jgi:hypothetical protein
MPAQPPERFASRFTNWPRASKILAALGKTGWAMRQAIAEQDGQTYEVDFRSVKTGVCTCPDFQKRGDKLHVCKHTARVVLDEWPDNYERYQAKVRELATASIAALPADPAPPTPPEPPTPPPTAPAASIACPAVSGIDAALIAVVVEATLPIVMALVMDTLAASTADVTAKVLAALAKEVKP